MALDRWLNAIMGFSGYMHPLQVIVVWTANTERFCDVQEGLNTTANELMISIAMDKDEVSPSTIFAVASILEGVRLSMWHFD